MSSDSHKCNRHFERTGVKKREHGQRWSCSHTKTLHYFFAYSKNVPQLEQNFAADVDVLPHVGQVNFVFTVIGC